MTHPSRTAAPIDIAGTARIAALWSAGFAALLAAAFAWLGVEEMLAPLRRLAPGIVVLALGLALLNYLLRAVRWQVLCAAMGLRLPVLRNGLYYVAGFAFTVTPGKVGEAVRLWLLRRDCGAAYERTLGLLVVDRVTDALPLLALCLIGLAPFAGQAWGVALAAAIVLSLSAVVLRPGWLVLLVKAIYARVGRGPRLFARALRLLRTLEHLVAPAVVSKALLLGLLGWTAEALAAWWILDAVGIEVGFAVAAFVFAFGMLVGALPLFPGGVGGAEGAMVGLLLLLGADTASAVAATAVIRLCTLGFAVVLGFLALPICLHGPGRDRLRVRASLHTTGG